MPVFRRRAVLRVTRNLMLLVDLKVGVIRGPIAGDNGDSGAQPRELRRHVRKTKERLAEKEREVERATEQLRKKDLRIAQLENQLAGDAEPRWSNSRRRGDSTLLRDKSKPVIAAIDLTKSSPEVRWIEIKGDAFVRGATGLCFWNDLVCVAHQGAPRGPHGFVLLNPDSDFEQVHEGTLPHPAGVHSVCSREGALYFVTTRRDGVYRATLDESSGEWNCSPYWTFPRSSGEEDENHLNAIDSVGGHLYVSGFGHKRNDQWPSATQGFVYDIDREEYVTKGIYHPHSLLKDSGVIWTCESARNRLISDAGEEKGLPSGYIRGLAISEDSFYVGSSKRRKISESTGVVNRRTPGEYEGNCCIYRIWNDSDEPEVLVDFSGVRNEIYEMVLI
jgi:hypothetical protein